MMSIGGEQQVAVVMNAALLDHQESGVDLLRGSRDRGGSS